MKKFTVFSQCIDYVRFRCETELDVIDVQQAFQPAPVNVVNFHGHAFADITGEALAVFRSSGMSVLETIERLAYTHQVYRLDVAMDVIGREALDATSANGHQIMLGGVRETVYSCSLAQRGNVPQFTRVYDAMLAGHYDRPTTRVETQFNRELCRGLIDANGWNACPFAVALYYAKAGAGLVLNNGFSPVEVRPKRKRLEPDRARFYRRFGQSIARDVDGLGLYQWYIWVMDILKERDGQ